GGVLHDRRDPPGGRRPLRFVAFVLCRQSGFGLGETGSTTRLEHVSEQRVRTGLPEDLELMPPGADLAALLDSVDRNTLAGADRLRLARARNLLASYVQARLLEDLYAVSLEEPPQDRDPVVDPQQASRYPWAETEVAFALRWTRVAAAGRLEQARELIEDLPAVHAALLAGEIDMPKALVICELVEW